MKYTLLFVLILINIFSFSCISTEEVAVNKNYKKVPPPYVEMEMVLVPAGSFIMGKNGYFRTEPERKVTITKDYYIGKYEVTNEQMCLVINWALETGYVKLINGSVYDEDGRYIYWAIKDWGPEIDWCIQFGVEIKDVKIIVNENMENHPAVGISWYGALAFCNFLSEIKGKEPVYNLKDYSCDWDKNGYRLPTDAEWEYAARGTDGRNYPWGNNDIEGSYANFKGSGDPFEGDIGNFIKNGGPTTPVGFYNGQKYNGFQTHDNSSPFGAYDMAGNIGEWVWDYYVTYEIMPDVDPREPLEEPRLDPRDPLANIIKEYSYRSVRDGAWSIETFSYMTHDRMPQQPHIATFGEGLRVAMLVEVSRGTED